MALNDYAYYNKTTGLIENVIWLDTDAIDTLVDFPPEGFAIVDIPTGGIAGAWSMCGIGWSYINGQFVEPPEPEQPLEQLAATARSKRDSLLAQTDWTQAADVPQATKDLWAPYRQALRDVPQQSGFPTEIVWPVKP
jgi:hypothetical protein